MGCKYYALFFNGHLINESTEKKELVRLRDLFVKKTREKMRIVPINARRTNKTPVLERNLKHL